MKAHTPAALAALSLLVAPAAFAEDPAKTDAPARAPADAGTAGAAKKDAPKKSAPAAAKAKTETSAIPWNHPEPWTTSTQSAKARPVHTAKQAAPAEPDGKACDDCKLVKKPWHAWLPDEPAGNFTLGTMVSEDSFGVYLDGITGLWAPEAQDKFLFLNSRYHWEDHGQFISSTGLGYRQMIPGHDVIVGGNIFWDSIHSEHGNDLDQLGLGLEVLSKWVDFRFNYYLPEDDQFEIGRSDSSHAHTGFGPGGFIRTTKNHHFKDFESGLEGFNTEVGFLLPCLQNFAEVRAYVGYYHYDNPFGSDLDGFKARLEARLLRGVVANVEYWNDKELMGGHWTGEIAVSVPFSLYNLFTGKNPFEGAGDSFKRLPRPFSDRMSDMVERSHRIQTITSGDMPSGTSTSTHFTPLRSLHGPAGGGGTPEGFPIE